MESSLDRYGDIFHCPMHTHQQYTTLRHLKDPSAPTFSLHGAPCKNYIVEKFVFCSLAQTRAKANGTPNVEGKNTSILYISYNR